MWRDRRCRRGGLPGFAQTRSPLSPGRRASSESPSHRVTLAPWRAWDQPSPQRERPLGPCCFLQGVSAPGARCQVPSRHSGVCWAGNGGAEKRARWCGGRNELQSHPAALTCSFPGCDDLPGSSAQSREAQVRLRRPSPAATCRMRPEEDVSLGSEAPGEAWPCPELAAPPACGLSCVGCRGRSPRDTPPQMTKERALGHSPRLTSLAR